MDTKLTVDQLENETEWLHLYPQAHWHDDASIVGNRKAIEALRDALTAALSDPDGVACSQGFTTDGAGYQVGVYVLPFGEMERMAIPYTDAELCGEPGNRNGMWPWHLARKPKRPNPPTSEGD